MQKVFRSHHAVPDVPMSPTLLGLAKEWVAINGAAEYHSQVRRLNIEGCNTPGDLVDLIDSSPTEQKNQILHALIVADTYVSTRVILQAFLPRLLNQAQRRSWYGGTLEDHLQEMISELWQRVAEYPRESTAARWTTFTTQRLQPSRFVPEDEQHLPLEEDHLELPTAPEDTTATQILEDLFRAGLDRGLVTADDLELLNELYLGIQEITSAEVASNRGCSAAAVRKRSERIKKRLALLEV